MRVMISTPAYGGLLTVNYVSSLLNTLTWAAGQGIEVTTHFQDKESLIPRARDRAAHAFLSGGYDKLFTIDADIQWSVDDFRKIVTSDHDIVGGVYALKGFPARANFNREKDGTIRHIPTGFMCVTRKVFDALTPRVFTYLAKNSAGETTRYKQFYPSGVCGNEYESEDYGLCRLAKNAGFDLHLDETVQLGHVGTHVYRPGHDLTRDET
jgi:hypothetical protein